MINKTIHIDVNYEEMGVEPSLRQTTLTTYILDDRNVKNGLWKKRPAVIVCPGGGYANTSEREGEPVAMAFCAAGFHSFVLDYSVAPSSWPAATVELSKSLIYVRKHAKEYNIDPEQVYICGFSAGGHLVASLAVHYNHPDIIKFSSADGENNKPNGVILGYPVITGERAYTHENTINRFVGGRKEIEELAWIEKNVTPNTPEMFLFHTFTDEIVPVKNTLRIANALEESRVKFELHIYPDGVHALSLANEVTAYYDDGIVKPVQNWIDMAIRWIKDRI